MVQWHFLNSSFQPGIFRTCMSRDVLSMFSSLRLISHSLVIAQSLHTNIPSHQNNLSFLQFFSLKTLDYEVCPEALASTMSMSLNILTCGCCCCPIHSVQAKDNEPWPTSLNKEEKLNPPTDDFLAKWCSLSLLELCSTHGRQLGYFSQSLPVATQKWQGIQLNISEIQIVGQKLWLRLAWSVSCLQQDVVKCLWYGKMLRCMVL